MFRKKSKKEEMVKKCLKPDDVKNGKWLEKKVYVDHLQRIYFNCLIRGWF